jgi:hypothetical protein
VQEQATRPEIARPDKTDGEGTGTDVLLMATALATQIGLMLIAAMRRT